MKSRKAFTLVEIMILVVIAGLLAAMAIPAYHKVRADAIRAKAEKAHMSVDEYRFRHKLMEPDEARRYRRLNGDSVAVESTYSSSNGNVNVVTSSNVALPKEIVIEGKKYRLVE